VDPFRPRGSFDVLYSSAPHVTGQLISQSRKGLPNDLPKFSNELTVSLTFSPRTGRASTRPRSVSKLPKETWSL
jgi:hypothetical protein